MKQPSLMLAAMLLACSATAQNIEFASPKDGDTVTSPFMVRFMVKNMQVAPAGEMKPGTGHHHILINTPPIAENNVIPADGAHRSYGEAYRQTIRVTVK